MHINSQEWGDNSDYNLFSKLIHSAMMMGLHKNKEWIKKLILSGRVRYEGALLNSSQRERRAILIPKIMDVMQNKYGDDWDMYFQYSDFGDRIDNILFIHIYDKMTVQNSQGNTHDVEDLVVAFQFDLSGHVQRVMGTRLALGMREMDGRYLHSHLPSRGFSSSRVDIDTFQLNNYCIGSSSESEVSNAEADFNSHNFDAQRLELYLYTIDTLVAWESIEGNPHIKMTSIPANRHAKSYDVNWNLSVANQYMDMVKAKMIPFEADFYISEGRYKVKDNKKLTDSVIAAVKTHMSDDYPEIMTKYNPVANIYVPMSEHNAKEGALRNIPGYMQDRYLIYRGQKKHFRIINQKRNATTRLDEKEYSLHPNVINHVITKLESELYNKAVRLSRAAKENFINNTQRSTGQNQVLM